MATKNSSVGKVAAGLGLAALAAGAAAYYFSGPTGRQRRAKASAWVKKAKGEMVREIKKTKTFSKRAYDKAAKQILSKYKQAKNVKPEELSALSSDLKDAWTNISKDISSLGKKKTAKAS